MNRSTWIVAALCLLTFACGRSRSEPAASGGSPQPAAKQSAAPLEGPAETPPQVAVGVTGVLSEQEFKRLHELKGEAAPPRLGKMIELADKTRAYLSLPKDAKPPLPALVVIHEWWGLNEHIQHYADRLAGEGYAALAVDLFGEVAATPERAMALTKAVKGEEAKQKLLTAYRHLADDPSIRATRRGSIGWCFGGKWSLNLALAAPDMNAAVVYYGHVTTDPERLATLKVPVLGIFAERDASIPLSTVKAFEAGLEKSGVPHRILTYDAEHAFANPSGARYDQKAAEAAYRETRAFLAQYLRGEPGER